MILAVLESFFEGLVFWEKILATCIGVLISIFAFFKLFKGVFHNVREANKSLSEFLDIIPELKKMTKEFGSNGHSLKDVLYRLENNFWHSDQKIKVIASCLGMAAFETDKNGLYTFVNKKWSEITKLTFAEALGNGWVNIVIEDDREDLHKEWMACVAQNREFHTILHLDKLPETTVSVVAWPIRNLDGSPEKFFGILI